jgi:hypothetical protein
MQAPHAPEVAYVLGGAHLGIRSGRLQLCACTLTHWVSSRRPSSKRVTSRSLVTATRTTSVCRDAAQLGLL